MYFHKDSREMAYMFHHGNMKLGCTTTVVIALLSRRVYRHAYTYLVCMCVHVCVYAVHVRLHACLHVRHYANFS